MRDRKLETVSDILRRVVRSLDIEREIAAHSVEPIWSRAVGERVSANTRPSQLRSGVLVVEARSAAWMNEASLLREQIRERVNEHLGGTYVREVRFRLGGGFPPLVPPPAPPPPPSDADVVAAARELDATAGTEDGARLAARAFALSRTHKR